MSMDLRPLVMLSGLANGGAERVTVSFVRRLRAMGVDARVCTVTARTDGPLAIELANAPVPRRDLGARRLADPRALLRLCRLLVHERPDLMHVHGQDAAILAAGARRIVRVPLTITRHVLDEPGGSLRQRLRARAACASFRHADAAVAVSRAAAERLAELTRLPRRSIHVIPNGIELERFNDESSRWELRAALGVRPENPLILVPAVLRAGKGHETLLDLLPALLEQVPRARVAFAGGGERESALRAHAGKLPLEANRAPLFLGQRDDIPALLAACDLVVLPSLAEALPTALIEAAASGRPVVATRTGGIPEVVVHGVTGLLVPPGDPAALLEAMVHLLQDEQRACAYGTAGRRLARQRFSIDTQIARTMALWRTLVGGTRKYK